MVRWLCRQIIQLGVLGVTLATASQALAQGKGVETLVDALEDSTVIYEANFFSQYSPVSVNDMIDRIPGIYPGSCSNPVSRAPYLFRRR